MKIQNTSLQYTTEPIHPLGFKGGTLTELWQITAGMETDTSICAVGEGVQSPLWSDSSVFSRVGPLRSNEMMYQITAFALKLLEGETVCRPDLLIKEILPEVMDYAQKVTGENDLRTTYALNALTPVDWALWRLYRESSGDCDLARLAEPVCGRLSDRQTVLGNIPLISYQTPEREIRILAEKGRSLFKIKIGSNPDGKNDPEQMLQWDIARFKQIHEILSGYSTVDTCCGRPAYYLDANGRYDSVERMLRFLDAADRVGALDRILLLEEPFPETNLQRADGIPVPVAGDESAHSAEDAVMLIEEYGYSAIALKPIAKTLSISLEVLKEARKRNVMCFCADLTVNPRMLEMNKLVAAHLKPIRGMNIGVLESNGSQNYLNWDGMVASAGLSLETFAQMKNGKFILDEDYYNRQGCVWDRRK